MTYQPTGQAQFAPITASSGDDCVPTTCAMGADRASVGGVVVNHETIRKASGQASGGMAYSTAVIATAKATGVKGTVLLGITSDALKALLAGGHACTVSIDTHATHGTIYQTGQFQGDHSIFANAYYPTNDTANVKDPGTNAGYQNWPFALLVKAALLRTSNHGINVISWPDTEAVIRKATEKWRVRSAASLTATPTGTLHVGQNYTVHSTVNGGQWQRKDGGISTGWHHITTGFVVGRAIE